MTVAHEYGLVFNKDKYAVKQTCVVFLDESMNALELTLTLKGQCSPQDACSWDSNSTTKVPWIGNLPVTLHTLTLPLYHTSTWAAEERNRVHLEQHLSQSIWQGQINGLQGYHTVLWYFDVSKLVTVQDDASTKGLGAALLQDGCPVAFASKALTPVEQCYTSIECKLLTSVFRAETFHNYVFGHATTIESKHMLPG